MILCDTGVIVGVILADDSYHKQSVDAVASLRNQLVTTWPCITEAMYLVGTGQGQEALQGMIESGFLKLTKPSLEDARRVCVLMRQYADSPMDFADASLVAAAEQLGITKILTFDSHFFAYRINGKTQFQVMPS
jgi:predicted nucleic acid-binding protein